MGSQKQHLIVYYSLAILIVAIIIPLECDTFIMKKLKKMFRKKRHGGWHGGWGWDQIVELPGWESDHHNDGWEPPQEKGWGEKVEEKEEPKGWGEPKEEKKKPEGEEIMWVWGGEENAKEVVTPEKMKEEIQEGWGWPEKEIEKEKRKGGKVIVIKLVRNKGGWKKRKPPHKKRKGWGWGRGRK